MVLEPFAIPGDVGFGLGGLLPAPASKQEGDAFRAYIKQAREEVTIRLVEQCYTPEGAANKFWMAFAKKKFMNKSLE